MTAKKKPAYTGLEKLIADEALSALHALNQAFDQMKIHRWHESEDRHLKTAYIGTRAALLAQGTTALSLEAIVEAETAGYVERLPAWNGYPDDESPSPNTEAGK